jgi:hypothetical protein
MTKPKPTTSPPVVVIYGRYVDMRPWAAGFDAARAELAEKTAESLGLRVLQIDTADQIELAGQLPSGQIHALRRGTLPAVSEELFRKVLESWPELDCGASEQPSSAVEDDAETAATVTDGSQPASAAAEPKRSPSGWLEIEVGDLVLAEDLRPHYGWYEAVVLEHIGDDQFKLRFRDYPEEGSMTRRRDQLGLLPPA